MREDSWRGEAQRAFYAVNPAGQHLESRPFIRERRNAFGAERSVGRLGQLLRRRKAGPELQAVTAAERLFRVDHAAPGAYALRVAGPKPVGHAHAVAMLDAAFQQVA